MERQIKFSQAQTAKLLNGQPCPAECTGALAVRIIPHDEPDIEDEHIVACNQCRERVNLDTVITSYQTKK